MNLNKYQININKINKNCVSNKIKIDYKVFRLRIDHFIIRWSIKKKNHLSIKGTKAPVDKVRNFMNKKKKVM